MASESAPYPRTRYRVLESLVVDHYVNIHLLVENTSLSCTMLLSSWLLMDTQRHHKHVVDFGRGSTMNDVTHIFSALPTKNVTSLMASLFCKLVNTFSTRRFKNPLT